MIAHFLRGYSWEPAPVFDRFVSDPALATRHASGRPGAEPPSVGPDLRADRSAPASPASAPGGSNATATDARGAVNHLSRYLTALDRRAREGGPEFTPGSLYRVDGAEQAVREVVGFRLRGHPLALMGAFIFPRHTRSPSPDGRPSLASFLSRPPRTVGYAVDPVPPGHTTIFLPRGTESIPAFMARLREQGGVPTIVDTSVIDVAFDLRFANPSEIRRHAYRGARAGRSVFRTIAGHVLSGLSVGLSQTLHTGDRFITLADAIQHRPDGDVRLPTIAVNRSIIALQSRLPDGEPEDAVRATLAFHPTTARREHLFGALYDTAIA